MKLCIVGTGYVGLVSAACFAEMGNSVTCIDVNKDVVARLNAGSVHIFEPGLEPMVRRSHADGRLKFTTSLAEGLVGADCAFICVGTPPGEDGSCDLHYVEQVAREIGRTMENDLIVVDKSTVPVGSADRVRAIITEELAARGRNFNFEVVSNPEFLKEGDAISDFMKPDRVVIGTSSDKAAAVMRELYAPFARTRDKVIVMGIRSAEMTKYAANCMLATKISFINEIATICERVGADVRDVRNGIGSDARIGSKFLYPGCGYGGSCFPKDVKALIHTAEAAGMEPKLLNAVEAVNARQKLHMAERIKEYFAPQGGVKGKTLALWGLAFKANTAWNMTDMLCNAVNSGTGSEARLSGMPVGGKTGTTTNNCDRWFVGFTPYYVAAVWTGYDMPEYMNFSGNPAAQIWKLVMESIHKDLPTKSFPTPNVGTPTGIFGDFSKTQNTGDTE